MVTIHYAGGNAYSYRFVEEYLASFEIINFELPGRGKRIREDLFQDSKQAVDDLVLKLKNVVGSDYILYGHSLGALLAYAAASELAKIGNPPKAIVVSGNAGPSEREKRELHKLPDSLFQKELATLGGIPDQILNNSEMMEFFTPILRADIRIAEEFDFSVYDLLNIPIHVLMGHEEKYVSDIDNWKQLTKSKFRKSILQGDHFFILKNEVALAKTLNEYVECSSL